MVVGEKLSDLEAYNCRKKDLEAPSFGDKHKTKTRVIRMRIRHTKWDFSG